MAPHFKCKSELFNFKYASILLAKIISWIEYRFAELSTDLQEVLINLNSYICLRTVWNTNIFIEIQQNQQRKADLLRMEEILRLCLKALFSFDLVNKHLTAINYVVYFWIKQILVICSTLLSFQLRAVLTAHISYASNWPSETNKPLPS